MPSLRHLLLYLGLALLLTQLHAELVNHGSREARRLVRHAQILEGTGDAPWGYRVAVPMLVEAGRRAIDGPLPRPLPEARSAERRHLSATLEAGYLAVRFAATAAFLVLMHAWLATLVRCAEATAGTLLAAALHGPSYAHYWFQPASTVDLALWAAALVLLTRGRDAWVPALVVLGALNRETSVFIVLLYGAMRWEALPWGTLLARCAGLLGLWAMGQAAVRAWVGPLGWAGDGSTPLDYLAANLGNPSWLLYMACFFGVLWIVPALTWRQLPPVLRRLTLVMLPYVVLQLLFGRVREVRLFLPLALVLVPAGLLWLRGRGARDTS